MNNNKGKEMLNKTSKKNSSMKTAKAVEDDFLRSLTAGKEEGRKIGLYSELDGEKSRSGCI